MSPLEDAKEEDPLPPVKVGDIFGKNLSKKDVVCKPLCQFVVSVAPGLAWGLWFF